MQATAYLTSANFSSQQASSASLRHSISHTLASELHIVRSLGGRSLREANDEVVAVTALRHSRCKLKFLFSAGISNATPR